MPKESKKTTKNEEFDNNLRGALFVNDKKEKKNQPDYRGQCEVNGVEYWISGWKKKSRTDGSPYLSLAFTVKEDAETEEDEDEDEEIPF